MSQNHKNIPGVNILLTFLVLCIFLFTGLLKVYFFHQTPAYDPKDDTAFFWTESAIQYRYAKMIAEGEPLPDIDHKLQWPEGVDVHKDLTVVMEHASGYAYRLLGPFFSDTKFHVFLIYFISFFSSLALFPVFLIAVKAFRSKGAGLFAAALYGISLPAVQRVIGNYGREDFAIPLIITSFYFFLNVIDRDIAKRPALFWIHVLFMGAFQFAALASWHFARFFYLTFVSFFVLAYLLSIIFPKRFKEEEASLYRGLAVFTVTSILAGIMLPVLSSRQFIFSLPLLISYVLILGVPLRKKIPARTHLALTLASLAALVILKVVLFSSPEDTHVYGIFLYKLKHLLMKPADPNLLPFEVRSIWLENGNTPHLREILSLFGGQLLILILSLIPLMRKDYRETRSLPEMILLYFACLYLVLYIMVTRTSPLFALFLAVACGSAIPAVRSIPNKSIIAAALGFLFCVEAYKTMNMTRGTFINAVLYKIFPQKYGDLPNWRSNNNAVVEWFRRKSLENDPLLARFATGPMILAYADRPIILQPKYETRQLRKKVEDYYPALFGREEDFYGYCKKYGARYFLYETITALQFSPDSERYLADKIKLPSDSAVFSFQFRPERLHYFTLEYQNTNFRIFKVHPYREGIRVNINTPYQPIYDINKFRGNSLNGRYFSDGGTYPLYREIMAGWQWFQMGKQEYGRGNFEKAHEAFLKARSMNPGMARLNMYLGLTLLRRGDQANALKYCREEIDYSPFLPEASYNLGRIYYQMERYEDALRWWEKTQELNPSFQNINNKIRDLKSRLPLPPPHRRP